MNRIRKLFAALLALLPVAASAKSATGLASYYHDSYAGRVMANGARYDPAKATLATWEFPLGTRVRITYLSRSGQTRQAEAVVTDRGPAKWVMADNPQRRFDLSRSLFKQLETPRLGLIRVTVEEIK